VKMFDAGKTRMIGLLYGEKMLELQNMTQLWILYYWKDFNRLRLSSGYCTNMQIY